jgi:dTDP-glucose pyrophosphorylase/predicted transcriptional regulator
MAMTPTLPHWRAAVVGPTASIREALVVMGKGRRQIALVADGGDKLLGTVTDGDVRRSILNNISLDQPVTQIMYPTPSVISPLTPRVDQVRIMQEKEIHHLPVVDIDGHIVGLVSMEELLQPNVADKPNWAVLLVGGLGSRLRPLTDQSPKPLIPVGGRPVLETIVKQLRDHGIQHMYFAVNHMADAIKAHFADGERFDVHIEYLEEEERLGTAGPLGLLPARPAEPFIVMNGDILTNVDFTGLLAHHAANRAQATVATRTYEFEVPFGVIANDGYRITDIAEKPKQRHQVNAGIYAFEPGVLDHVAPGVRLDMPDLLKALISSGSHVVGFPIHEYWIDIGRLEDLQRASGEFAEVFS